MDLLSSLENPARTLFRRCVQCPNQQPVCPTCPANQVCQFNPWSCNQCASTSCVPSTEISNQGNSQSSSASSSNSSNAGAIAGAVIGGLIVIGLATYLAWRFCIKPRRRAAGQAAWQDNYNLGSEKSDQMVPSRDPRASTHTVGSVASSAFTRASNIIQIAYIPGVTNRSEHSSQDLVPPVPPIPAASAVNSPRLDEQDEEEEQHYFRPEIRDSRYSAVTDRNSIASTVYRSNAIVSPVPAQMVSRAKPTAVSVRSSNKNSPAHSRSATPPLPANAANLKNLNTKSSIVGRVGQPKPVQIMRKGSRDQARHIFELDGSGSETGSPYGGGPSRQDSVTGPYVDSPSEDLDEGRRLMAGGAGPAELSANSTEERETGLWGDEQPPQHKKGTSLNQIIEEAALSASRGPASLDPHQHPQAEHSPFDDAHEAHTP